ncbi:MAG TPA: mechanosensitive ion channel domain-containing protein [Azospirillaceae bacterium]|nr:mechanosensitive ion channel domain-containing protein [Azospirillaceae bacterium]
MPSALSALLKRLLPVLLLALLAVPAAAQDKAAPAPEPPKAEELEKLVRTLEDPAQRQQFLDQLKSLTEARKAVEAQTPETPGMRALTVLSSRVEDLSQQIADAGRTLVDTPKALRWLNRQVTDPELRNRWARLLFELTVVLAAGYAARLATRWLLSRPRRALENRPRERWLAKLPLVAAHGFLDALPIVAFALAGFGTLSITAPPDGVQQAARLFINASLLVQVVMLMARLLLSPEAPTLRLLRISDESAHYLYIWVRRIAFTAVYGNFIASAASLLGLPSRPYFAMLKLVGLVVVAMLLVLVLQNRRPVAEWLRGTPLSGPLPPDPDAAAAAARHEDAVMAAAIAGTAPPEPPPPPVEKRTALRAARRRLADVWHLLAMIYLVVLYGIWALEVKGGFEYVLWATLITFVTIIVARLVTVGVDKLIRKGFSVPDELKAQYPGLEQRANLYLPVLHRVLKGAIWFIGGLVILQAWGVDSLAWLASPFGQRVSASAVSIVLVIALALLAWEVVSSLIERYLTATDRETGQKLERSARVRTLLPLLRNAFMVVLIALVTLTTLSELGLDIAPLLAGAGVIGLAIGFGAQTLVKDVITGLFILFEDTIAVGDVVDLGGTGGVVEGISIRTIRLRDFAGTVHTIPFSNVTTVSNLTKDFSFAVFNVAISYTENPDRVIEVLGELGKEMRADPVQGANILEPIEIVGVDAFLDSSVTIKARIKTRSGKQWAIQREFNKRMKKRFDEVGIEIPFPQRTVHIEGLPAEGPARAAAIQAAGAASD